MATVRLQQVGRAYAGLGSKNDKVGVGMPTLAVQEISFTVPEGEFWVLVGPSGCGKSTILRMIAGLSPVTTGDIWIGDRLVNTLPARQRDVAMVFQTYALYPHMTVAENLGFGLKMRGVSPAIRLERVREVAEILGLAHLLNRKPRQLSGGQQQRVALGRAIARQAQVFLFDEPLSNLDAQLRDNTRSELKQLHQRLGGTSLYVTHDQTEAMTLADRIIVLDQGRIQQMGAPQEIYQQPVNRMVATFFGNPPMNVLPVVWRQGGLFLNEYRLPDFLEGGAIAVEQREVDLGIRPEQIHLASDGIPAQVTLVEPLGKENLVRVTLAGGQLLTLVTSPAIALSVGDSVGVGFDLTHACLFDRETGQSLI
jgi:multiple sugar transport system ATP-binding protein